MRMMHPEVKKGQTPFTVPTATASWATATVVWFPYRISHFLSSGVSGGAWIQWMFHQGFSPDALPLLMPNCSAWAVKHHLPPPGRARQPKTNHSPTALGRDWAPSEPARQRRAAGASVVLREIMAFLKLSRLCYWVGTARMCKLSYTTSEQIKERLKLVSVLMIYFQSLYPSSVSPLQS